MRKKIKTINPFFESLYSRLFRKNRNWMVMVIGSRGSGKSNMSLSFGEAWTRFLNSKGHPHTFNVNDNVVWDTADLVKNLKKGKLRQGSFVLSEELGVSANARNWYTRSNKILNNIAQTCRTDNLIIFFTVPESKLVDTQTKLLFDAMIELDERSINHVAQTVTFRLFKITTKFGKDAKERKMYRIYFVIKDDNGRKYKLNAIKLRRASKKLEKEYDIRRAKYTEELKNKSELLLDNEDLDERGIRQQQRVKKFIAVKKAILENINKYKVAGKRFDTLRIMEDFGLKRYEVTMVVSSVKKSLSEKNI